jgi:hypothetical protein
MFNELIQTRKKYMRNICIVQGEVRRGLGLIYLVVDWGCTALFRAYWVDGMELRDILLALIFIPSFLIDSSLRLWRL